MRPLVFSWDKRISAHRFLGGNDKKGRRGRYSDENAYVVADRGTNRYQAYPNDECRDEKNWGMGDHDCNDIERRNDSNKINRLPKSLECCIDNTEISAKIKHHRRCAVYWRNIEGFEVIEDPQPKHGGQSEVANVRKEHKVEFSHYANRSDLREGSGSDSDIDRVRDDGEDDGDPVHVEND